VRLIVLATVAILLSLGTIAKPLRVGAAAPEVVLVDVQPFVATVGDRLTLTIIVEHDAGTTIARPGRDLDVAPAEIVEIAEPVTVATTDGRERTTLTLALTSFTIGTASVPPIEIAYESEDGGGAITTGAAPYVVDSVVPPGEDTLRPLKPQLEIPQPAPAPVWPAGLVALMLGLTAFGYWLMRRGVMLQPASTPAVEQAPPPRPDEIARERLDELGRSGMVDVDPAEYYARLAATVRQYLAARFAFNAQALTRREMEREMRRAGIDRWPARLTANLLEQCDAVQFARFRPAVERRRQDLDAAYEIVATSEGENLPQGTREN
jgi:hypothetical protein